MDKQLTAGFVTAIFTTSIVGFALAGDLPKEGTYDVTVCSVRILDHGTFSDARWMSRYEQIAMVRSNPPGGMFATRAGFTALEP